MGGILVGVLAAVRSAQCASDSGLNYCGLTGMSSAGAVYARFFWIDKGESRNWHDRSDQWRLIGIRPCPWIDSLIKGKT
jgi:hypothetical protein